MGMFSGVTDADPTGKRNPYFQPGNYKVKIDSVMTKTSRQGVLFFIVEATILESDVDELKPGTQCSWLTKINSDMGPINIKRFVAACQGLDPFGNDAKEIDEEDCEVVVSDGNPCQGLIMELKCSSTTTKAGQPFTIHNWQAAENVEAILG